MARVKRTPPKTWLVDSGATHHMTRTSKDLTAKQTRRTVESVRLGDGNRIRCTDEGTIRIAGDSAHSEEGALVLENTLVVPDLEKNLISVYGLLRSGYDVHFRSKSMRCEITRGPTTIVAVLEGKLWTVRDFLELQLDSYLIHSQVRL